MNRAIPTAPRRLGQLTRLLGVLGWIFGLMGPQLNASPQSPSPEFRWTPGQALRYRVEQTTLITQITRDGIVPQKSQTKTTLNLEKTWTVKAVSPSGVATLELTLQRMQQIIERPGPADRNGQPTIDRVEIDSETSEGKTSLAEFLNQPVLTLQIDSLGQVSQAQGKAPGTAERLIAEPPFRFVWPATPTDRLKPFTRTYDLVSPLGTGETFRAQQTFERKTDTPPNLETWQLKTDWATPLKSPAEGLPVLQYLWQGTLQWDRTTNSYYGADLTVMQELKNHDGPGSEFKYESRYRETRLP